MKKIFLTALIVLTTSIVNAEPSTQLVTRYLEATKAKEAVEAQVNGFSKQYATSSTPEQMTEINRYLNSVIGWDAIRPEYIKIIQAIYTIEEIKASIGFINSTIGKSIAQKNIAFSERASALMARNVQAFAQNQTNSQPSPDEEISLQSSGALSIVDLERHQNSDQTYFTGRVMNSGKKPARRVQIEINLFQGKKFVDQYSTYISGVVPTGGERLFKVTCGCKGSQPAPHDSYSAAVIESF